MTEHVIVYTTKICGYCHAAKRLLDDENIPYEAIDVTTDSQKRLWLMETTGMRTVPQIFFGNEPIGGYDQLNALKTSGQLHQKLAGQTSS
jgi:glutaredoxin 3